MQSLRQKERAKRAKNADMKTFQNDDQSIKRNGGLDDEWEQIDSGR